MFSPFSKDIDTSSFNIIIAIYDEYIFRNPNCYFYIVDIFSIKSVNLLNIIFSIDG
jgi:hypothetical protein